MLSAAEGSCRHSMKLPGDPSAALSMTDFPLSHFQDFEYIFLEIKILRQSIVEGFCLRQSSTRTEPYV